MSATAAAVRYRIEAGFVFPDETIALAKAEQRRLHGHCGIPPERYGETCDVGLLARRPILATTAASQSCLPDFAPVHIVQRLRQHAPVALGETLALSGRYVEIGEARRGLVTRSRWEYRRADGALVLTVEPDVMLVDPGKKAETPSVGKRPAAVAEPDGGTWTKLARKECTPETTCGYCLNTTNLIHTDPATAQRYGYRAPIIAGNQTVNFMLEALALDARPVSFDMEIRFRKPIFWDEGIDIEGRRDAKGRLTAIRAVNDQGVTVADATVNAVSYGGLT